MPTDPPPVIRKVLFRLIPLCIVCYLLNYIDRVNISIAKFKMLESVPQTGIFGFTEAVFTTGAAIFFVGYFLFELPSNLIMERVGARRWIARIMISWGIVTCCFVFTRGKWSFYTLRFLLGLAEAGFFPGVILYLSYWIPQKNLARAAALFLTSTAISGVIGNPLGGCILYFTGSSPMGLHNWQWLFLSEGIPSIVMGLIVLFYLTDRPRDARWLDEQERKELEGILADQEARHTAHDKASLLDALKSPYTWIFSLFYCLVVFGYYMVNFFTPTIIKTALINAGVITKATLPAAADLWVSLLAAIPFGAAAVGMVLIGKNSDRKRERKNHVLFAAALIALGLVIGGLPLPTWAVIAGLSIAAIGAFGIFGPFWALPSQLMAGTAAAAAFAIINSIGNLGGFIGPTLATYLGPQRAMFLGAGAAILGLLLMMKVRIPELKTD